MYACVMRSRTRERERHAFNCDGAVTTLHRQLCHAVAAHATDTREWEAATDKRAPPGGSDGAAVPPHATGATLRRVGRRGAAPAMLSADVPHRRRTVLEAVKLELVRLANCQKR